MEEVPPSSKGRLFGKTACITGSSSGLGSCIAHEYASEGANLCLVDLYSAPRNPINPQTGKADEIANRTTNISTLDSLIKKFGNTRPDDRQGPRFIFVYADVTIEHDMEKAIDTCVKTFGRLDIMVNNAGISTESTHVTPMKIHETSMEEFDRTMAINVRGVFLGCKYALKQMVEGQEPMDWDGKGEEKRNQWDRGWVVSTASIQGLVGYLCTPAYTASKGSVVALTKQIALDYAKYRIHCNALCPGFLRTAMTQNLQSIPETLQEIESRHPWGTLGDPEDVARAALFLASRDCAWITGVPLPVDGGYCAQ